MNNLHNAIYNLLLNLFLAVMVNLQFLIVLNTKRIHKNQNKPINRTKKRIKYKRKTKIINNL